MSQCYDCRDECTKDFHYRDILNEDGDEMRLVFHDACYERATNGGAPVYPEREQLNSEEDKEAANGE